MPKETPRRESPAVAGAEGRFIAFAEQPLPPKPVEAPPEESKSVPVAPPVIRGPRRRS